MFIVCDEWKLSRSVMIAMSLRTPRLNCRLLPLKEGGISYWPGTLDLAPWGAPKPLRLLPKHHLFRAKPADAEFSEWCQLGSAMCCEYARGNYCATQLSGDLFEARSQIHCWSYTSEIKSITT